MKRECTEIENAIIKECAGDILSPPETYAAVFRSNLFPTILGAFAGLGLGTLVALKISVTIEIWIRFILLICVAVTVELFVLIWQIYNKKKICKKRIPGNKFWVNGGTIISVNYSEEGAQLIYTEDDLTDTMRNPCCIMYPAFYGTDIKFGERILLVYSDSGAYIPLRVTERTRDLISQDIPEYFGRVNWKEAVCLPHPAAVDLDQKSSMMYEYEKIKFVEKCNSLKSIRIKNWIGIVLLSFLILFLFGILFIALVAGDIITEFYMAVIFAAMQIFVWIFLTYRLVKAILSGSIRRLKKIQYKKKVMFHSISDTFDENNIYTKYVSVYEYINGVVELVPYAVNSNLFLPKNLPYGKIIYKYSQDAISCAKDINFFGLME